MKLFLAGCYHSQMLSAESNNGQSPLKVVLSQGAMSPLHMNVEIHIDTMLVSLQLLYQCFQSTDNAEQCRGNALKRNKICTLMRTLRMESINPLGETI